MDGSTIGSSGAGASPADLSAEALEAEITELAGHLNAATYRWLL